MTKLTPLHFLSMLVFYLPVNGQDTLVPKGNINAFKISNKLISFNSNFSETPNSTHPLYFSNTNLSCTISQSSLQFQSNILNTGYVNELNHYESKYYFSFSFDKNYFVEQQRKRLIQKYISENNIQPGVNDINKEYENKRSIINQPSFLKERDSISRIDQEIKDSIANGLPVDSSYAIQVKNKMDLINQQLNEYSSALEKLKAVKSLNKDELAPADTVGKFFKSLSAEQLKSYSKQLKTLNGAENLFNSINAFEIGRFQVNNQFPVASNLSLNGLRIDFNLKQYYFALTVGKRCELHAPYSFSYNPMSNASGKVLIAKTGIGKVETSHIHIGIATDEYQSSPGFYQNYGFNTGTIKSKIAFTDIRLDIIKNLALSIKMSKLLDGFSLTEDETLKYNTSYFIETNYYMASIKSRFNISYLYSGSNYRNTLNPYIQPGSRQIRASVAVQPSKKISIQVHSEYNSKLKNLNNNSLLPSSLLVGGTASYFYKKGSFGLTSNLMYVNYNQSNITNTIKNNYLSSGAFLQFNSKLKQNISSTMLSVNFIDNRFYYGEYFKQTPGFNANATNNTALNKKLSLETRISGTYKSEYQSILMLATGISVKMTQKINISPGIQCTLDQYGKKYMDENIRIIGAISKNISFCLQGTLGSSNYNQGAVNIYNSRFSSNFMISIKV